MSRGINYEEVELQAENLLAKGQNPTLEKVRRGLGDRGSHTTLSKYLNEWRKNRSVTPQSHFQILDGKTLNKPALPDPVNVAVSRVWQQLQEESAALLASSQEEALKAALQHTQDLKLIESLENDIRNLKIENAKLEKSLAEAQKDLEIALGRTQDYERCYNNFRKDQHEEKDKLILALTEARERIAQLEERHRQFKFIDEFLQEQNLS